MKFILSKTFLLIITISFKNGFDNSIFTNLKGGEDYGDINAPIGNIYF